MKEGWTVSRTERYVEEVLRDQAKEKKVRRPLFIRDVRFFLNTLDHSLTVMRSAGVDAKCQRVEEGGRHPAHHTDPEGQSPPAGRPEFSLHILSPLMDVSRETSILFSTGKFPETPLSGGGIP